MFSIKDWTTPVSEEISKFSHAESLRLMAEKSLAEGDLDRARTLTDEMEAVQEEAETESDLTSRLEKAMKSDMKPMNTVPVASADVLLDQKNEQRADGRYRGHTDANYRPAGWVKSDAGRDLPAMAQPSWVLEKAGDAIKADAEFQTGTWLKWFTSKSESSFFRNASADETKAMQEDTDNEGGYFVPEEFISQTFNIPDAPGGQLRDKCTVVRVTSKDGYLPTLGGTTFAAIAEEAAYTGVESTPVVGQVSYATQKYGSLIRVSDELLADSIPNLPNLLSAIFASAWGRKSQAMITGGNGTNTYQGIVNGTDGAAASTTFYTMANATSIVAADIVGAYFDVPAQFRSVDSFAWVFTSELGALINSVGVTAAGVHAISDLTNAPDSFLMGRPVVYSDVTGTALGTSVTSTEKCGVAGDFSSYYLFERAGISVSRNDSLYQGNGQVGFFAKSRGDGRMAVADAFRILRAA
jgi:HK97 family phage major capsid protein